MVFFINTVNLYNSIWNLCIGSVWLRRPTVKQSSCNTFFIGHKILKKDKTLKKKHEDVICALMEANICRKDFSCYHKHLEGLCEATIVGDNEYIRCDESPPVHCDYILNTNGSQICQCQIRKYIALHIKSK